MRIFRMAKLLEFWPGVKEIFNEIASKFDSMGGVLRRSLPPHS
jgi:hypothetical protein